ncbi:hypothetical protein GQR60_03490 [Labilibaculum sp. A4]|uniref:hypothetical protein n=1 Tax=Labilibaculum euxinus TaxID=2686357 RepID=UPI000F61A81A|nr:hypothetical protein [Labilibaculum euxinus]MDQ1770384.1 hypothetical protein [Labilibaculum euxinus]MWN75396.1 hypothetical protein [Labilibaculum euxinus]
MTTRKLNWNRWMQDGDQFLKGATPKGKKSILGNTVRYNMLSMSLEGYIMAILDYHQNMPQNHTYSDLIYGLEEVMPIDATLKKRILKYENIQSICSLEKYHRSEPTDEDLVDLFGAIQEISKIAHETCIESV